MTPSCRRPLSLKKLSKAGGSGAARGVGGGGGVTGRAIRGPGAGQQLKPVQLLKDYWFDWENYHPKTLVYGYRASQIGV